VSSNAFVTEVGQTYVVTYEQTGSIDLSGKTAPTNAALGAGYAIFGNDGKDVIKGTNWDDLIVGGR